MIVITEAMDEAWVSWLRKRSAVTYEPDLADRPEALAELAKGAKALIVGDRTPVKGALLGAGFKCIGRLGVGPDNIDTAACKARHIAVYPAVGANALSVAEYVVTTAAVLLRGAYALRPGMEAGAWPQAQAAEGREIAGKTIGLIGFGGIARVTAGLAHAMGMAVTAHDPFVSDDHPAWGSTIPRALGGLIKTVDVISLHVPLTPKTANMMNAAAIAQMKPGAILINTSQGGVVDEGAVADALRSGHLGGAALDTFAEEPLGAEHPFKGAPNLILTPHVAGVTAEATARTSEMTARAVARHLRLAA